MLTILRAPAIATLLLAACIKPVDEQPDSAAGATSSAAGNVATPPGSSRAAMADPAMRLEVDLAARRLYVFRDGAAADTHSVAVGTQEWPTQAGEFRISQVVWNPDWIPPEEEWAKDEERKESGDPENPLGRAQLVYDPPRSIHGTNEPSSIGKAASHGSIRMRNEDITALARAVMEAGGVQRDAAFFEQVRSNRRTKQVIDLATPVPIRIR